MTGGIIERIVDAVARRPNGSIGRLLYRHPIGHVSGFHQALTVCPVVPSDRILDVGCGAGVFLEMALQSECDACGLDHSPDMVAETSVRNADAIAARHLNVALGDAAALPFASDAFNKVFCLNAFFFFPQPQQAIAEMARVTVPGGTVAIITASPNTGRWARWLFGPVANRMRFDTPEQLEAWGRSCGLEQEIVHSLPANGFLFVARKIGGTGR